MTLVQWIAAGRQSGSGLIETFSFNLFNGHLSEISNTPVDTSNDVCVLNGIPSSIVVNPAGTFAYAVLNANNTLCQNGGTTGIQTSRSILTGTCRPWEVNAFNQETVTILGTNVQSVRRGSGPYVMDPSGKFLLWRTGRRQLRIQTLPNLRAVPLPIPFSTCRVRFRCLPSEVGKHYGSGGVALFYDWNCESSDDRYSGKFRYRKCGADADRVSRNRVNGVQNSVCSTLTPPTTEYLYAVDGLGNQVFEFQVNTRRVF